MANDQDLPEEEPLPPEVEVIDGIAWYRGSRPFEELEFPPSRKDLEEDYNWAMHNARVRKLYSGQTVVVRHRKVWGAGKSRDDALEQALEQPGCPPTDELVFVAV